MMAFAKGTGGAADAKAAYYGQATMPQGVAERAAYYLRGVSRGDLLHTAAVPRPDMAPEVAAMLGLDPARAATLEEVASLIEGVRADGHALPGDQRSAAYKDRVHVTYYDFNTSAPKSVSIAFALAPTEAERAVILQAHEEANAAAMAHLETRIGRVRRTVDGHTAHEAGALGWVSFLHVSARPTVHIPHTDPAGRPETYLATVPEGADVPGDPDLHTHNLVPNAVLLPDGTVGCMDTAALHNFVHEAGAVYQFTLATRLRAQGVAYGLDPATELGHIPDVPRSFVDAMSKRSRKGEAVAREFAAGQGLDWDALSPDGKINLMRHGVHGKGYKRPKSGEAWSEAAWRAQARDHGYEHRSVIAPGRRGTAPLPAGERHRVAYEAALPMLEHRWDKRAVLDASAARVAAGRGLIASGAEGVEDMDAVVRLMREHGVRHEGQRTELVVVELAPSAERELADRRGAVKLTTRAHLDQETEALALIAEAAGDRTGALHPEQVDAAVARVAERDGLDFENETGREQRRIMDAIAEGGRFVAVIGSAGVGKTTLLRPVVDAWQADGREVFGVALAWRQAHPLAEARIPPGNLMAVDKLLHMARDGRIELGPHSVVVVDELGQVGTRQQLALARLRAERGFTLVAAGDDRQGNPVAHGNPYALIRRAIGADAVPELATTVRQRRERDRETTLLFRAGRGAEGVARLREDGHAMLVPGGRDHAVQAVADLWAERTTALAGTRGATVTVSAPTNADARDIAAAIREHRRVRGEVGADAVALADAQDQNGATFPLRLAPGDRVRVFDLLRVPIEGKPGAPIFATNGSVLRVEAFAADDSGFTATNAGGHRGTVRWDALRDRETGRIRLTYGDALSIDAVQGATSTEHINALPSGSAGVHSRKAYVPQSRARETTWLVVSDGMERSAIAERRPIGDPRPVSADDVWAHVAANFSRDVRKELALELLDRAHRFRVGTARDFAPSMRETEAREKAGQPHGTHAEHRAARRDATAANDVADTLKTAAAARTEAVKRLTWARGEAERQARRERRSARPASQRPKRETAAHREAKPARPVRKPVSASQAEAEFREALHSAGLRPKRGVHLDGKLHYSEVDGGGKKKRGTYVVHMDGWPAGTIINHKTGARVDWRASADGREMTPGQQAAERARQEAARLAQAEAQARRAREREAEQAAAGRKAETQWRRAAPADAAHPYLTKKRVEAHGTRRDARGNLLVPMRDADGRLWGVQTIAPDGAKLFARGGRISGTFAMLGEHEPGKPLLVAEGFATAATLRELTGLPVAVAFNAQNLRPVAEALRTRDPAAPIIVAADNDHHLPRRPIPLPNAGLEKGNAAAEAVGGAMVAPAFTDGEPGTDWNDFARLHGPDAAREAIGAALKQHGIAMSDSTNATARENESEPRRPAPSRDVTTGPTAAPPRRRVERPVADAGDTAREASRMAQERARAASQDRGHSR